MYHDLLKVCNKPKSKILPPVFLRDESTVHIFDGTQSLSPITLNRASFTPPAAAVADRRSFSKIPIRQSGFVDTLSNLYDGRLTFLAMVANSEFAGS